MNGSCGRMGYAVEWYHESLGGIIGAVALLRSKVLDGCGFLARVPRAGRDRRGSARELGLPAGRRAIVQAKQVHGGEAIDAAHDGARPTRRDALVGARRRRPSPWACASPTACPSSWPTRRAGTSRPSTPAGAASSPASYGRASSASGRPRRARRRDRAVHRAVLLRGRVATSPSRSRALARGASVIARRARREGVRRSARGRARAARAPPASTTRASRTCRAARSTRPPGSTRSAATARTAAGCSRPSPPLIGDRRRFGPVEMDT